MAPEAGSACLDSATAVRFLHGEMSSVLLDEVRDHIEICDACLARVATAVPTDEFSQEQRSAADFRTNLLSWVDEVSPGGGRSGFTPLRAGVRIGPYVVLGVLGRGGMGVVYRARHVESGRVVALKTVARPMVASYEGLRDEIVLLKEARHEGVVEILDACADGHDPWYAMELLVGETLAVRKGLLWSGAGGERPVVANGHLPEVVTLFARLCMPLEFVHRSGIVHGDLKPSNVFLRGGQVPVLMDFGLGVRASGAIGRESLAFNRPRGTLHYISPETLQGQLVDSRADLYALGCMLYEALTGHPPFVFSDRDRLIDAHLHDTPPLVSENVSGVPPALDELLARLLAKDPRERIGHAEIVEATLVGLGAQRERLERLAAPVHLLRSKLVGRADVVSLLLDGVNDARAGRGSLVFVEGESGIGKTFVVSEVVQRASRLGLRIILGQCVGGAPGHEAGQVNGDALHPFQRGFEAIRDECMTGGEEAVERLLGDSLGVLAPYSSALAELATPDNAPAPLPLPEAAGRERLLKSMIRALRALSAAPTLLVLDDLQWADELSLSVIERLAASGLHQLPLFVIATRRAGEGSALLERLLDVSGGRRIQLGRLDESSVASMTAQMLGVTESPHALARFVYAQSEGVPFFVAEYLRSAQVDGALLWDSGTWHLSAGSDPEHLDALSRISFPARLRELVRRRLVGLGPGALRLLETAAVAGREFDLDIVCRAMGADRAASDDAVRTVAGRYVVDWVDEAQPRFAHDKFRETIYADIEPVRRVELHRQLAFAIESVHGGNPEFHRWYGELARHLRLAGDTERALEYLEKAGNRALAMAADAEAVGFLVEAVRSESTLERRYPPEHRALWERGIADAKYGLGLHGESAVHLTNAARLLGRPLPKHGLELGFQLIAHLVRQVVHRLTPSASRRSLGGNARRSIEAAAGEVFERLHRTSYYTGNTAHLLLSCIKSLNYCESSLEGAGLARAYANAAAVCSILPAPRLAEEYLGKAQQVLDEFPDPVVETALRMVQGVYFLGNGRHAEAILYTEQGIGIAELLSYGRRRDECLVLRTAIELHAGRVAEIDSPIALLEASSRARNDMHTLAWSLIQRLEAFVIRGDAYGGVRHGAAIRGDLEQAAAPEQIWGFGLGAYLAFRAGDHPGALELARRVGDLSEVAPPVHVQCVDAYDRLAETWLGLAQVQGLGVERRELERRTRRALGTLSKVAGRFPVARPMAALHLGTVQWRKGRRGRALRTWHEGLASARIMKLEFHEARLLAALGTALADDPVESARAWEQSDGLLERLRLSRTSVPPPAL